MPNKIELLVLVENGQEPKRLLIEEDGTFEMLIREISPDGEHELDIFIEGEDLPRERHRRLLDCGIKHGHHVHCRKRHHDGHDHNGNGHHHPPVLVPVVINNNTYQTQRGVNTVAHLRSIGKVPADEVLSQFKDGKFVDLDNAASVEICGGEKFSSHTASAGSS